MKCWFSATPITTPPRSGTAIPANDRTAAAGRRANGKAAFAVQLGDLTQGDCGRQELQEKSFRDALAALQRHLTVPLYPIKGNHDIRGHGAPQAYDRIMLPYLNRALQTTNAVPGSAHYAVMHEQDLFLFFDSIRPDVDFVEKALAAHPEARHVFFLTHLPVLPCATGSPEWIVFGRPDRPQERRKLLALLAGRHAIVLCAHVHRTTLFRYRAPEGTITQVSSFSMPAAPEAPYAETTGDGSRYFAEESIQKAMQTAKTAGVLADFAHRIVRYGVYRPGAGFNLLRVESDGGFLDLHFGASARPAVSLTLTAEPD